MTSCQGCKKSLHWSGLCTAHRGFKCRVEGCNEILTYKGIRFVGREKICDKCKSAPYKQMIRESKANRHLKECGISLL